jgi:hypothetical protein
MNRTEAVKKIREMQQIADRFELCMTDHDRLLDEHNRLLDEHNRLVDVYNKLVASHTTVCDELSAVGIGSNRSDEFDPWSLGPINEPGERGELDSAVLAKYVNNLIVLRQLTDPHYGERSTFTKTERADIALSLGAELLRSLVEWAIDHRIGRELLPQGGSDRARGKRGAPSRRHTGKRDQSTTSAVDPWSNDHRFELSGRLVRWDKLKPREAQLAAGALLEDLEGLYPSSLTRRLRNGMAQVIVGSEPPIFRPVRHRKGKGRNSAILWTLRAHAVGNVFYRAACGRNKMYAVRFVANEYGVSPGNIQIWENRLPGVFGQTAFRHLKRTAEILYHKRHDGVVYIHSRKDPRSNLLEALFTDEQLARFGQLYRRCNSMQDLSEREIEEFFPQF